MIPYLRNTDKRTWKNGRANTEVGGRVYHCKLLVMNLVILLAVKVIYNAKDVPHTLYSKNSLSLLTYIWLFYETHMYLAKDNLAIISAAGCRRR